MMITTEVITSCGSACGLCVTRMSSSVNLRGKCILNDINLQIHCGQPQLWWYQRAGNHPLQSHSGRVPHTGKLEFLDSEGNQARPRIGMSPSGSTLMSIRP